MICITCLYQVDELLLILLVYSISYNINFQIFVTSYNSRNMLHISHVILIHESYIYNISIYILLFFNHKYMCIILFMFSGKASWYCNGKHKNFTGNPSIKCKVMNCSEKQVCISRNCNYAGLFPLMLNMLI